MFDIGFWELTLIAVIGLIVLGPERLPVVARTLGRWIGRAKGYARGLTSELEREVRADEMREQINRTRKEIESDTHDSIGQADNHGRKSNKKSDEEIGDRISKQPDGSVERGGHKRPADQASRDDAPDNHGQDRHE